MVWLLGCIDTDTKNCPGSGVAGVKAEIIFNLNPISSSQVPTKCGGSCFSFWSTKIVGRLLAEFIW